MWYTGSYTAEEGSTDEGEGEGNLLPKLIKGDTTLYIHNTHMESAIYSCYLKLMGLPCNL